MYSFGNNLVLGVDDVANRQIRRLSKMSVDDDALASGDGASFWEPGGYKPTSRRVADSLDLCNDLMAMIEERCELEKRYASSLKAFSKKYQEKVLKGPEYNSMERATLAMTKEADSLADVHLGVRERLLSEVHASLKRWAKDTFHKDMWGRIKEKEEFSELFRKAQKPWIRRLKEVERCKKDYYALCQKEASAQLRVRNAQGDESKTEDDRKKLEDEVAKLNDQKTKAKREYEGALTDIHKYNVKYIEDMREVFNKNQEFERNRLRFFKQQLTKMHDCIDFSNSPNFQQIYVDFLGEINQADERDDLTWWSRNRGVDMPMQWPAFEEYEPDNMQGGTSSRIKHRSRLDPAGDLAAAGTVISSSSTTTTTVYRKSSKSSARSPSINSAADDSPRSQRSAMVGGGASNAAAVLNGGTKRMISGSDSRTSRLDAAGFSGSRRPADADSLRSGRISDDESIDERRSNLSAVPASKSPQSLRTGGGTSPTPSHKSAAPQLKTTTIPQLDRQRTLVAAGGAGGQQQLPPESYPDDKNPFGDDEDDEAADEASPKSPTASNKQQSALYPKIPVMISDDTVVGGVKQHADLPAPKSPSNKQHAPTKPSRSPSPLPTKTVAATKPSKTLSTERKPSAASSAGSYDSVNNPFANEEEAVVAAASTTTTTTTSATGLPHSSKQPPNYAAPPPPMPPPTAVATSTTSSQDEWDNPLSDDGRPGVRVRALFDYEGAEDDELSFRQGDIFEKLEEKDEQGWCKGRRNGQVGLMPAEYVEEL